MRSSESRLVSVVTSTRSCASTAARVRVRQEFLQSRTSMISLLEQTTRLLPDHTWLVSLQVANDRMTLEGRSLEATSLVTLLNDAPGLSDARFNAPVTRDPATGADRFRLGAAIDRPARAE